MRTQTRKKNREWIESDRDTLVERYIERTPRLWLRACFFAALGWCWCSFVVTYFLSRL